MQRIFILIAFFLGTVLTACATVPPTKSVQNLKSVAGKWAGTGTNPRGHDFSLTFTIKEDGSYTAESHWGGGGRGAEGDVWVKDGKLHWKSRTTNSTGVMTLHKGDGKRILKAVSDRGSKFELTPVAR